jgi:hypothetical protein
VDDFYNTVSLILYVKCCCLLSGQEVPDLLGADYFSVIMFIRVETESGSFMFKADSLSLKPACSFLRIKALISIPLFYYTKNGPQKGASDYNLYYPTGSIVTCRNKLPSLS